ncbi:GH13114 [Drosophila grimshawi]|uniref:GH13114 n=1 Tax=Drosophila grimshawi TaxID=7222 RepID=B4JQU6_DROGR|nr:GH13114 [Drosophila grimshawi]
MSKTCSNRLERVEWTNAHPPNNSNNNDLLATCCGQKVAGCLASGWLAAPLTFAFGFAKI